VLALVLVACGADSKPDPSLSFAIERDRAFDVVGRLRLSYTNTGDDAVVITHAELRSDLFEPSGPDDRVTTVPAGRTISMPLRYGRAACDEDGSPALSLRYEVDDRARTAPLGDASAAILRLHAAACADQSIRDAVDISFGDDWHAEGSDAVGTIVLDPRGDADVELLSVTTQIVFVTRVATPMPTSDDVEVVATVGRCDAHALTESKKTFTFVLDFTIDGGEPVRIEQRAPDGPVLDAMNDAIDVCVAARTAAA
jgi:hypothetical protein